MIGGERGLNVSRSQEGRVEGALQFGSLQNSDTAIMNW